MCMTMPDVRVGEPLSCGSLAVFPLFSERSLFAEDENRLEYLLAHEAMARGTVVVTEVSDEGVVGDLLVRNDGETPVLMLDGSSLMGGKQSRVLNTTALLGGRSETRIPVSCIEVGRWGDTWGQFKSGSHCPPSLRRVIKEGSLSGGGQSSVWMEISRKHRALGVSSRTGDLGAALEAHREKVERLQKQFPYPVACQWSCRRPLRQGHRHRYPRQARDPGESLGSFAGGHAARLPGGAGRGKPGDRCRRFG